jgi:CheY-like chemotaxis protein
MMARRLRRWGADVGVAHAGGTIDEGTDAVLVDLAIGADAAMAAASATDAPRRIVLVTPAERHRLPALRDAGFTGYLVKPVRAASLMAQLAGNAEAFDGAARTDEAAGDPAGSRHGLSVLVAEDNEINAMLVRALLTKLGHRATVAGSGGAALESWRATRGNGENFDLVLMDVHMPGIDGLEAARLIRATEAEVGGRTPIVALTASAFAEDRDACLAAGMDGVLVKPLDRDRLAALLANLPARQPMAA